MVATKVSVDLGVTSARPRPTDLPNRTVVDQLFPSTHVLLPQINQIYELELAYGEFNRLTDEELIQRGAYFRSVHNADTYHYKICINTPDQVNATASKDRKNFFLANVFAVGYATHGLFPYRGKFHPQMIKAIINIIGLRPGNVVLDPMAGCGTTAIEANIMGIHAIAWELNPFACLMTRAKVGVLNTDCSMFPELFKDADFIYKTFAPAETQLSRQQTVFVSDQTGESNLRLTQFPGELNQALRELLLLCYFDSVGYAARRTGKTPRDLFPDLLSRYLDAVRAFNEVREELSLPLGTTQVVEGDARNLDIPDDSVDGVVFSPPYSFAIDYVENDRSQLELLSVDISRLKQKMVGLNGSGKTKEALLGSRVENYFTDMERIMRECRRVLRPGRFCVIVIGSNTNQTGGVSLEAELIKIGSHVGMPMEFHFSREIEGIRNTMRDEFLLFFRKPHE